MLKIKTNRRCNILARQKVHGRQRESEVTQTIAYDVPVQIQMVRGQSRLLADLLGFSNAPQMTFGMNQPHKVRPGWMLQVDDKKWSIQSVDYYPSEDRMEYQTGNLVEANIRGS